MNKLATLKTYLLKSSTANCQYRFIVSTQCVSFKTRNANTDGSFKADTDHADTLMHNAPKWNEQNATESEADVKADKEPNIPPEVLNQETAEWVRKHKDKDGNIPPQ